MRGSFFSVHSLYISTAFTVRIDLVYCNLTGSGVNLLLITPEKAIKLVGNDFFRHHLKKPE